MVTLKILLRDCQQRFFIVCDSIHPTNLFPSKRLHFNRGCCFLSFDIKGILFLNFLVFFSTLLLPIFVVKLGSSILEFLFQLVVGLINGHVASLVFFESLVFFF